MNLIILVILACCYRGIQGSVRKFSEEYPNVTVCRSSVSDDKSSHYDMPQSYLNLKAHFGLIHKCTHIEGNLIIRNIHPYPEEPDLQFLSEIVEVSGMVLFDNNSISRIILPKLRIIRGEQSIIRRWKGGIQHNISLYIHLRKSEGKNLTYLQFPSLQAIQQHSVMIVDNSHYLRMPYNIKWSEIFENEAQQKFLTLFPKPNIQCHKLCQPLEKNDGDDDAAADSDGDMNVKRGGSRGNGNHSDSSIRYCWSEKAEHCQKKTKCRKHKGLCKWCRFETENEKVKERCCSTSCIGGCYKYGDSKCYACQNYLSEKKCVPRCPPKFTNFNTPNPDFKVRVGRLCSQSCPDNLLQQNELCVYKCWTQFKKIGNQCVRCSNAEDCEKKECNTTDFIKKKTIGSFYMTKDILKNITRCEHLFGQLHFTHLSFLADKGQITVPMLYRHLKNLKRVSGDILIDGANTTLHNLTFLQNLEIIEHLGIHNTDSSAFRVFDSDIKFLGLRKLRYISGDIFELDNPHLCYWNSLRWNELILRNNRFLPTVKNESLCVNKECDTQCGSWGCWGPGNSMCYRCVGVRAGMYCVSKCEDQIGYYTSNFNNTHMTNISYIPYDNGVCKPCHGLCGGRCTGPNVEDCVGPCKFFRDNDTCVESCSRGYYGDNKQCHKCYRGCLDIKSIGVICTGRGQNIGKGGCKFCLELIESDNNQTQDRYQCYFGDTPEGYYRDEMNPKVIQTDYPLQVSVVYRPCTKPCKQCTGSGLSLTTCGFCNGVWSSGLCRQKCLHKGVTNITYYSNTPNSTCPECDSQCRDGCTVPFDSYACHSCLNNRLHLNHSNINRFQCLRQCPPHHNISYWQFSTGESLCLTKKEYDLIISSSKKYRIRNLILFILAPIILILLFVIYVTHKIRIKSKKNSILYLKAFYSNLQEPDSKILLQSGNKTVGPNMNRLLLIQNTDLDFNINGKPLGQGAFGDVYKGVWKLQVKDRTEIEVAVKVMNTSTFSGVDELLKEAKVMASVSHRHCLRLIGVYQHHEKPCLVTSFMPLGSLDKYLTQNKYTNEISSYTMLSWAEQIANGMAYLEIRGIIHRDLATRNVLLQSKTFVQITDFGLAKFLQGTEANHEIVITSGRVPIRWLAPETLISGIYSHKTDVWAYGVTLWEIFTYCQCPYSEMPIGEIKEYICQGHRLVQPDICSPEVFNILTSCWGNIPYYRPSFHELMTTFTNYSNHSTYYLHVPNDSCLQYNYFLNQKKNAVYEMNQIKPSNHRTQRNRSSILGYLYNQWSADGTVSTEIDDEYQYDINRQISQSSWVSRKNSPPEEREKKFPLLNSKSIVKEEEVEGYLEPLKSTNHQYSTEPEYLEPISKYQ